MASKLKSVKAPRELKARLKEVGKEHNIGSVDEVVYHFVTRGLAQYGVEPTQADQMMDEVVDNEGYGSREELIEHLLLRGLHAYEAPVDGAEKLAQRLRGLGYIE